MQKDKSRIPLSSNIYHIPHTNISFTIARLLVSIVAICIIATFTIFALSSMNSRDSTTSLTSDLENTSNQPKSSFVMAWGGKSDDHGNSLVQTSDGGYAVTGYTASYGAGKEDMFLAKYDSSGTLSWSRTWGDAENNEGRSIVQTNDGGYAVTGSIFSYGPGYEDMFLVKYTSDGTLSWSRTWGGGTSYDSGYSLVQTSDGGYAVTGDTQISGSGIDMFLAKYTSDGILSWSRTWGGPDLDWRAEVGSSLVQTSDGGYAVTGYTYSYSNRAGDRDMFLVKYTSDGTLSWNKTWSGTGTDYGSSLVQTSDGGYAVTGYTDSYGAGASDMFLVKYDSSGTLSWNKTWGGTGTDYGSSLVQTSDGGYVVTGRTDSYGAGASDMFLVKYDSSGTLSWNKTWGDVKLNWGYSLVQTSDDGYAVTGYTGSFSNYDMFLAKYKSDGTITGCSLSMCQSPTAIITSPTAIITSPTATVFSPTASVSTNPLINVSSPTAISTIIIAL